MLYCIRLHCIHRVLWLRVEESIACRCIPQVDVLQEQKENQLEESPSYPGLTTCYTFHTLTVWCEALRPYFNRDFETVEDEGEGKEVHFWWTWR